MNLVRKRFRFSGLDTASVLFCVLQVAKGDPETFTDLVRQLTRRCETQLQKLRYAFMKIITTDAFYIEQIFFDKDSQILQCQHFKIPHLRLKKRTLNL